MSTRSLLSAWLAAGAAVFSALPVAFAQGDVAPATAPPAAPAATAPAVYDLGAAKHLKVLYAGIPDSPRAKSFMEFLQANFEKVELQDVEKLTKESAAPFDVVVCDGRRLYPMDDKNPSLNRPNCALLPDFTKPIVMIASMAGTVQHFTKIGWL
jgi:hypothetical protein